MSTISMRRRPSFLRSFALEAEPGGDPAPTDDPAPADPPADPAPANDDPAPTDPPADPDKPETFSREYVEKLRRENAAAREKAKTDATAAADKARDELAQSIGKALGLVKDDETVKPEDLLAQAQADRQTAIDEANAGKRDLAVLRNADKHGANTDELLDSAAFNRKLAALDPSADEFASQVDALIKETVDGNPGKFKRVTPPPSPGSSTPTGEQPPADPESKSLDDLRKDRQKRRGINL
jgi:hypothetical protein